MEQILKQQDDLLKFGEDLLRDSARKMREAAGPDAWRQAYEMWMVRAPAPLPCPLAEIGSDPPHASFTVPRETLPCLTRRF